ncbi:MAG: heme-binding protein [Myxococcota bacterium]|nr:heme-binding protein [Myxococcota bacterium]
MASSLITLGQFGCSVFGIRSIDEPNYTLLKSDKSQSVEIRHYDEFLVAQTVVKANYKQAGSVGFRRLFRFISGDNTAQQSIAMTAPVERYETGEKIAMTAPVFQAQEEKQWTISFVMPAKFTAETVPQPTDSSVTIKTVPARKVAVIRFAGRMNEEKSEKYIQELKVWCRDHGYRPTSKPRLAGYDPPFTLPFLRRNEIHINVEASR